jgi:hypothetical protein
VIAQYREEATVLLDQRRQGEYRDKANFTLKECKEICSLI